MFIRAIVVMCLFACGANAEVKTLTDTHGRSIDVEILKVEKDSVRVEMSDGREFDISFDRLRTEDREWLTRWEATQKAENNSEKEGKVQRESSSYTGGYQSIHDDYFYESRYGKPGAPIKLTYEIVESATPAFLSEEDKKLIVEKACNWAIYMYEAKRTVGGGGCGRFVECAYEAAYREVVQGERFVPDPERDSKVYVPRGQPTMIWGDVVMTDRQPPIGAKLCYSYDDGNSLGHFDLHARRGYSIGKPGAGETAIYESRKPWKEGKVIGYRMPEFRYKWSLSVYVVEEDGSSFAPYIHWNNPKDPYSSVSTVLPVEEGTKIELVAITSPGWEVVEGAITEHLMNGNQRATIKVRRIQ